MSRFINWDLLRNPYNWIVVILMLLIGVMALTVLQPALSAAGATGADD